ncbi:MAG: HAD family phosphatase [Candidatus Latescibacteria bacterium]|nr:HAD family phosphatase [Candidatus Latescibacterota bacterium]
MIDTIIFDADGVILDSEKLWDRGQEEFLKRRGFKYERDKLKHLMTSTSPAEGVLVMQKHYGFTGDPGLLARERIEIVRNLFQNELTLMTGFLEYFNSIKNTHKTCIATSLDNELLTIADCRLDLAGLFGPNIYTIAQVGHKGKPDPAIFLYAAQQLGSRPGQCLVIEDSPYGITAAKRAGMRCIGLATTYCGEMLAEADAVVQSFDQIRKIV